MINLARAQSDFDKIFKEGEAEELVKEYENQRLAQKSNQDAYTSRKAENLLLQDKITQAQKALMKLNMKLEVTLKENQQKTQQCQFYETKERGHQQSIAALSEILQSRQKEYGALHSHYTLVENAIRGEPF